MDDKFDELWVIEAPGKISTIKGILERLGVNAWVIATKGHFICMPDRLTPMGVDSEFHEFERKPRDIKRIKKMREMAVKSKRVIVASDADQEGDVIAWDVMDMIGDVQPDVFRVRLKGMDDESVKDAMSSMSLVKKSDAVPGRTRALIDRVIGATFSGGGVAVGRVGTALLGLVSRDKPTTVYINLMAPDKKGGAPWKATTAVEAPLTPQVAKALVDLSLPAMSMEKQQAHKYRPAHMGDIMIRASDKLGMSPGETARAMQRSYESGKLSYPRSGSHGMSPLVSAKIKKILEKNMSGYKFDDKNVETKDEDEVHDSPYPIGDVNFSHKPENQGDDDAIRTMIAQDLVKTGQKHIRMVPGTDVLRQFLIKKGFGAKVAEFVSKLNWHKDEGPQFPGKQKWGKSEVYTRPASAVLLEKAMDAKLGKPSTWGNHIDNFLKRGLVDANLSLTNKGREWIERSPEALLDPKVSAAIEKACDHKITKQPEGMEPWEYLSREIIKRLPQEIAVPIIRSLKENGVQPRVDFRKQADEVTEDVMKEKDELVARIPN